MTATGRTTAELVDEVLVAWFEDEADDRDDLPRGKRWFGGGEALDARLAERFAGAIDEAARGDHDVALASPRGALALVVLLDQFPRNVHRGDARAFAYGDHALAVAALALARGHAEALPPVQRVFLALPFEHDESVESQRRAIALLEASSAAVPEGADERLGEFARAALSSAREHAEIVERFGRYPYRNAVLGRDSTDEERAWLESGAKRFGQ